LRQVELVFPDTTAIADFIIKQKLSNVQVNSIEQTVISALTDKQIAIAETIYNAMVKKMVLNLQA
jgi:hypothetical protein